MSKDEKRWNAVAEMTIHVQVSGVWNENTTVAQVEKQARDGARNALECSIKGENKHRIGLVKISNIILSGEKK